MMDDPLSLYQLQKGLKHHACYNGNTEAIMVFLDRGADVYAIDEDRRTSLHYACVNGKMDSINVLVDRRSGVYCKR